MNGHWLSGTRKLNKHYQSGQGTGSFVLTGFGSPLMGFEYSGQGERYGTQDQRFYSDTTEKVIAAQMYRIFENGFPTSYTLEQNVHALYGIWNVSSQGWQAQTSGRWNATIPVWRYGEFRGTPYYAYDSQGVIAWRAPTVNDQYVNQNGIDKYDPPMSNRGYYDTGLANSFENMYNDIDADFIIPIYEVIALPATGSNTLYKVILTDGTFDDHYENQITLKGYKRAGIERVEAISSGTNNVRFVTGSDGHIYQHTDMYEITGVCMSDVFCGDIVFTQMRDGNGQQVVAGTQDGYICLQHVITSAFSALDAVHVIIAHLI